MFGVALFHFREGLCLTGCGSGIDDSTYTIGLQAIIPWGVDLWGGYGQLIAINAVASAGVGAVSIHAEVVESRRGLAVPADIVISWSTADHAVLTDVDISDVDGLTVDRDVLNHWQAV